MLRRILKGTAWLLGSVVVLGAGLYLAALAVNRNDRPPFEQANALGAALDGLAEVADEENAYVFMLGFAAPRDADPWRIGVQRANWMRRLRTDYELSRESDPYTASLLDVWQPEQTAFYKQCRARRNEPACFAALNDAGADVDTWLESQDWIVERYRTLLSYPEWRSINTYDHRGPGVVQANATRARDPWFIAAWHRARAGDAERVRELLDADLAFWRNVLAESHTLSDKLIAASYVELHFQRTNTVLKQLPAESVSRAVPDSWRAPLSDAERSLQSVFGFELRFARNTFERIWAPEHSLAAYAGVPERPQSGLERLDDELARPLLQTQDSINKRARLLALVADAVAEPYARIPAALEAARTELVAATADGGWLEWLYNPVGEQLMSSGSDTYVDYGARIADLEGVRRAALLTAELRGLGVEPGGVEAALADAELKHPYTGRPFVWDAEAGAIVFVGLSSRYGGRRPFWY